MHYDDIDERASVALAEGIELKLEKAMRLLRELDREHVEDLVRDMHRMINIGRRSAAWELKHKMKVEEVLRIFTAVGLYVAGELAMDVMDREEAVHGN